MLVSLILTKLPEDVLIHLTDQKPDGQEWTVKLLKENFIDTSQTGKMRNDRVFYFIYFLFFYFYLYRKSGLA